MDHRHEVATVLLDVIRERAGGKLPETLLEWRTVAKRLGVEEIKLVCPRKLRKPLFRDGVIWLPRVRHCYPIMIRFIAHETAEAGLEWEGEPPINYPSDGFDDDRHRIACLIEIMAVAWMNP